MNVNILCITKKILYHRQLLLNVTILQTLPKKKNYVFVMCAMCRVL